MCTRNSIPAFFLSFLFFIFPFFCLNDRKILWFDSLIIFMKENNSCILTGNFLFWSERTRFWSFGPHQRDFPWHLPDRPLALLSWQPPHPPDHSFRCTNRKIADIKVTVTVKVISSGSSRGCKIKSFFGWVPRGRIQVIRHEQNLWRLLRLGWRTG